MLSPEGAAETKVGHRQTPYKITPPPGIPGEGFLFYKELVLTYLNTVTTCRLRHVAVQANIRCLHVKPPRGGRSQSRSSPFGKLRTDFDCAQDRRQTPYKIKAPPEMVVLFAFIRSIFEVNLPFVADGVNY